MSTIKYNKFSKKPDQKTAFSLEQGQPIFSDSIYLLEPRYIHRKSPDFSLVAKSKHISGLFKISSGVYLGDFNKKALIVFLNSDQTELELLKFECSPLAAKIALLEGRLTDFISEARRAVAA